MNIAIGKVGLGSDFGDTAKKEYGGDIISKLFLNIIKLNPQHTFYYISNNNMSDVFKGFKASLKPKNLIDANTAYRNLCKEKNIKYCKDASYKYLDEWFNINNIHIDKILVLYTSQSVTSIWDLNYSLDKSKILTPLVMSRISSHILYFMSKHPEIESWGIIDDPRCFINWCRDLTYDNFNILGQTNRKLEFKVYKGYGEDSKELKMQTVNQKYFEIEKYFLSTKRKVDYRNFTKDNKFIITLHGTADRVKFLNDWIIKYDKDIKVYGKDWLTVKKCSNYIDYLKIPHDIFENKSICEIEDLLWRSKYTFIIPVSKNHPDFVTQKPWTMLYYGIIPFWCKKDYDNTNIYDYFPDYIKVSSPDELWEKIEYLENHPDEYKKLLNECYNLLDDKYFDKNYLPSKISKELKL